MAGLSAFATLHYAAWPRRIWEVWRRTDLMAMRLILLTGMESGSIC